MNAHGRTGARMPGLHPSGMSLEAIFHSWAIRSAGLQGVVAEANGNIGRRVRSSSGCGGKQRTIKVLKSLASGVDMVRALFIAVSMVMLLMAQTGLYAAGGGGGGSDWAPSKKASSEFTQAQAQIKHQNYPKAIELLQQALTKDDNKADVYNLLGYSYRKSGDLEKGQEFYQKALAINPNHKGALEYQGELYLMRGDLVKAKENLAQLDRLCLFGCEEYDDLKLAIDQHQR